MDLTTELIERAEVLTKLVASQAADTEQRGSVSPDVIQEFCDAGFMKILVPMRYGGYELGIDTMARVVRQITHSSRSSRSRRCSPNGLSRSRPVPSRRRFSSSPQRGATWHQVEAHGTREAQAPSGSCVEGWSTSRVSRRPFASSSFLHLTPS